MFESITTISTCNKILRKHYNCVPVDISKTFLTDDERNFNDMYVKNVIGRFVNHYKGIKLKSTEYDLLAQNIFEQCIVGLIKES